MTDCGRLINGLSFTLILISLTEIYLTSLLLSAMTNFLYFTNTHISTAASLIASLVSFPTSIKIHYAQSQNIQTEKHQDANDKLRYQKVLITVCTVLHLAAAVVTFICMGYTSILNDAFIEAMKKYQNPKYPAKVAVDQMQMNLECCGSDGYKDWFRIDWTGSAVVLQKDKRSNFYINREEEAELESDEIEGFMDEGVRWDTVPFSCCNIHAKEPCVTKDLAQLGSATINTKGCNSIVYFRAFTLFLAEICINGFCFAILLTLFLPTSRCVLNKIRRRSMYDKDTQSFDSYEDLKGRKILTARKKRSPKSNSGKSSSKRLPAGYFQIQPPAEFPLYNHTSTFNTSNNAVTRSATVPKTRCSGSSDSSTNDETLAFWMNYKPYTTNCATTAELKISSHEEHILKK